MKKYPYGTFCVLLILLACALSACGGDMRVTDQTKVAHNKVDQNAKHRTPYLPSHDVEFDNYNAAQKLYDDPTTIIWCSTTWGNASAPIVTVPIAGKLTSSSVSYFPGDQVLDYGSEGHVVAEDRSVDGMYHGSPPPYRYGFTPGGQYVDFFNMPTVCTTALTKFQRQTTKVSLSVDPAAAAAQAKATVLLQQGRHAAAERALENGLGQ
jgi:hypothetical protein